MPTYDRPTKELMKEFAATLQPGETFTRQSVIDWFGRHYPRTARRMVYLNVDVMSTNNINGRRHHPHLLPGTGHDLFFKIDRSTFRLWDAQRDPAPLYGNTKRRGGAVRQKVLADQIRILTGENATASRLDSSARRLTLEELRFIAMLNARAVVPGVSATVVHRARSTAIRLYALKRAKEVCEGCGADAPFRRQDGSAYLEVHHVTRVADNGPDHPAKVIALCPNCHRRAHYADDGEEYNRQLVSTLNRIEGCLNYGLNYVPD